MTLTKWPVFKPLTWKRDTSGYELMGNLIVPKGGLVESYSPGEQFPTLHRTFLDLAIGRDKKEYLVEFANRYGLLGLPRDPGTGGESVMEILQAWVAMQSYDFSARCTPPDPEEEQVKYFNAFCPQHMTLSMEVEKGQTIIKVAPGTLLAHMWLCLAQEKTNEVEPRWCAYPPCGKGFYVGKQRNRQATSRREYCSDKCRMAHNYGIKTGKFKAKPDKSGGTE